MKVLLKSIFSNYIRYDLVCFLEYISYLMFLLPRLRMFNLLKTFYLRYVFGSKIGKRTVFYPGVWIFSGRNFTVGDDVDFAKGVLLTTDGGLTIGDRVLIGYNSHVLTSNHRIPKLPKNIFNSGHVKKKVIIDHDVWIGANCTILPGVTIGSGSIVAAGSVVTKDIPENSFCAGVPAKVIKVRE
ncbi:acyltransferase [Photobacterium minamisatsumaniensis]|uniref:acyltransferase n=1 Tax=Photobacterium minamisatsumaniensis TaxID=2910233 RepID=UPI003D0EF09C